MIKKLKKKFIVGRSERVNMPQFSLYDIPAKIDTGAYTSCLHCTNIGVEKIKNQCIVSFDVLDTKKNQKASLKFPVFSEKWVKSSNGAKEKRVVILAILEMSGVRFETEFTLTDRSSMKSLILIGRKALSGRFLVDVSKINKRS